MIKCDQGKCFPKTGKWLTSTIKDANVIYDNCCKVHESEIYA